MKILTNYTKEALDSFLKSHPKSHFMQSFEWANVKSNWKHEFIVIGNSSDEIIGATLVLIRKLPYLPYTIMYAPRGPVSDLHNEEFFSLLVHSIKQLAKKYRAYVFKIDTDTLSTDEKFIQLLEKNNFNMPKHNKNFEGIQPRFVFRINNIAGKTEDEMLQSFESKTRYNIRLATKKGVTVKIASKSELPIFHKIMLETGVRDNFVTRSLSYFEKMYDSLGPNHIRLYMAYLDNKPIAGTLAILYGNKCWYLYGASSNAHRNVMPNYLLQFEMIKWALSSNCDIYDFRGVSGDLDENSPLYGLYRFKRGFNGDFTEFVGEADLVFKPTIKLLIDKGTKVYKSIRSKVFLAKHKNDV